MSSSTSPSRPDPVDPDDLTARVRGAVDRQIEAGTVGAASWRVRVGGVLVDGATGSLHDGTPASVDTIYRITSMTKPVAAVTALTFVDDGTAALDEPVERVLPELADRRVLRRHDGPVDDTVPAIRPIVLRDLLTFTLGAGGDFTDWGPHPYDEAASALGVGFGPPDPQHPPSPDEWIRRWATLPLQRQPGERWLYHVGSAVLGVWIARVAGAALDDVMEDRVLSPLGMVDTGFTVPADRLDRFGAVMRNDPDVEGPVVHDDVVGAWSTAPAFPSGGDGLVSTVDDYGAFADMLLRGGSTPDGVVVLSSELVAEMTSDQLTPAQRAVNAPGPPDTTSWGYGVGVALVDSDQGSTGSYGWNGGFGSTWSNDPSRDISLVLLTDRMFDSPEPPPVMGDVRRAVWA